MSATCFLATNVHFFMHLCIPSLSINAVLYPLVPEPLKYSFFHVSYPPFVSGRKGRRNVAELADPLLAYAFYLQSGYKKPNIIKICKGDKIKIKPQGFQ